MKNNRRTLFTAALMILTLLSGIKLTGQVADKLPRSTPENEGVSSRGLIDFLNAADTASRVELHSFMFIRHGRIIAEGWWKPNGPDYKHLLYSASKTFSATGIGLAVSEKRLKVTDKVVSFFPYSLPDTISDYMKELTVQNLLTMSVGQDPEPRSMGSAGDWINSFLSARPVHKPGSVFMYNNMASFMLSAIVQQVTGQTLFEYLQPRIFKPLGINGADWDLNPQGINLGMIGLRLHTEDLAKFGLLLLQEGVWNNKQLIPKGWVKEATSFKIDSKGGSDRVPKELNDWTQGYCYQMWRGRNNTVRLDGMAGQFVVLIPDKDAIVVFTANARDTQDELNLMHNYLIPAIKSDKALPANPDLYGELQKRQSGLCLKPAASKLAMTEFERKITGKEFIVDANDYQVQSVYFGFNEQGCSFALKRNNQISVVRAGSGDWKMSRTPSASLLAPPRGTFSKSYDANYLVSSPSVIAAVSYSWTDKSTLELTARFVEESLGSQTIECRFSEVNGIVRVTLGPRAMQGRMGPGAGGPPQVLLRGTMVDIR